MEDWGRVILSPEAASARFHDKVLVLAAGADPVTVSRADKEERPDTENAVFDCRVSVLISGGAHSRINIFTGIIEAPSRPPVCRRPLPDQRRWEQQRNLHQQLPAEQSWAGERGDQDILR